MRPAPQFENVPGSASPIQLAVEPPHLNIRAGRTRGWHKLCGRAMMRYGSERPFSAIPHNGPRCPLVAVVKEETTMEERMGEGKGRPGGDRPGDEMREGASRVGHLVDEVKQRGANILGSVKDKVSQGTENLRTKSFDEISGDVRTYVNNNPGRVILASFVVGLIVGSMVRSGRNRG